MWLRPVNSHAPCTCPAPFFLTVHTNVAAGSFQLLCCPGTTATSGWRRPVNNVPSSRALLVPARVQFPCPVYFPLSQPPLAAMPLGLTGQVSTADRVGAGWGWRLAIEIVTGPESEPLGHLLKMHVPEPSTRDGMGALC